MKILIETVMHSEQRYPTVGDWQWLTAGECGLESAEHPGELTLRIRVSEMNDWRCEALVAVHELIEALLCKQAGISEQEVDAFDTEFITREGVHSEPGDSMAAPYHYQHKIASHMEGQLARDLDVSWKDYEKEVDSL
jgi:hypothetical protein